GRGFDHFDPRLLSIKLGVELSLNGLEVSPLSHCIRVTLNSTYSSREVIIQLISYKISPEVLGLKVAMTSPMTNICPNKLSYLYDGHSWTEYAPYFVTIFKYVSEKNFNTQPIPALSKYCAAMVGYLGSQAYIGTGIHLHGKRGVQYLTLVDFYMKSLRELAGVEILLRNIFEHSDEIRRIFTPRVNVIEIRKRLRACIRRRGDHFEQNFAN
ncbi:hypothetical protein SFRURICE_015872, partial [Spodoptera frugiperda]